MNVKSILISLIAASTTIAVYAMETITIHPATIHEAVAAGNVEAVQRFIEADPDQVNLPGVNQLTPLHYAATYNKVEVARLLLNQSNLQINQEDCFGVTPLHAALHNHSLWNDTEKIVRLIFLHDNIDINKQDCSGDTPLHTAMCKGLGEIVFLLLLRGADITIKDRYQVAPIDMPNVQLLMLRIPQMIDRMHSAQHAFVTGIHARAGANSPIRHINLYNVRQILGFLAPEHFFAEQQVIPQHRIRNLFTHNWQYATMLSSLLGIGLWGIINH